MAWCTLPSEPASPCPRTRNVLIAAGLHRAMPVSLLFGWWAVPEVLMRLPSLAVYREILVPGRLL
jgi:hypothetical protein